MSEEKKIGMVSGNGVSIIKHHIQGRKHPSLCVIRDDDNCLHVVASFRSEENAELFMNALSDMCDAQEAFK